MTLPAAAGLRASLSEACVSTPRTHVGVDAVTLYDGTLWSAWLLFQPAADAMWTAALDRHPCLRLGLREHVYLDLLWLDPGGPESGWELQNKLTAAVGTELERRRWSMGAYLLPGFRLTVVHQRATFDAWDIDRAYTAAGVLPALYLYQITRFSIIGRLGVHADVQWSPIYPYREYGWYSNRLIGLGISVWPAE